MRFCVGQISTGPVVQRMIGCTGTFLGSGYSDVGVSGHSLFPKHGREYWISVFLSDTGQVFRLDNWIRFS